MTRTNQKGVSLVETLVALAVMGFVVVALLALIGQNTRFAASLQERNLAGIAADNLMVEALVVPSALETGESDGEVSVGERTLGWRRVVGETGVDGVLRIEISVIDPASGQILARAATMRRVS